jgi:hypothetical protein
VSFAVLTIFSYAHEHTQGLAVLWGAAVAFDLIVVVMTLVRVVPINRSAGGRHTFIALLMRDGKRVS